MHACLVVNCFWILQSKVIVEDTFVYWNDAVLVPLSNTDDWIHIHAQICFSSLHNTITFSHTFIYCMSMLSITVVVFVILIIILNTHLNITKQYLYWIITCAEKIGCKHVNRCRSINKGATEQQKWKNRNGFFYRKMAFNFRRKILYSERKATWETSSKTIIIAVATTATAEAVSECFIEKRTKWKMGVCENAN